MSKNFRYDISFLRVVAVISVILFHYDFSFFNGGFVGVDIFFVISGYLMTKIILTGFEKNNFNIVEFYKRRINRIIPALLATILLFGFAIFFIIPTQFVSYLQSAFSSSLFYSNIYYYRNIGYFDQASHNNFLLHTWSLSVEWQFYMVYPLILLPFKKIYKRHPKIFIGIFSVLTLTSFVGMLLHSINDQSYSFYITYTRAWEMLAGGIIFLNDKKLNNIKPKAKILITILSLLIFVYFFKNADAANWPSIKSIFPVLATAFIIGVQSNYNIYKSKIITYLGDLSYSLYLYHWPLYVFSLFFELNHRISYKLCFIALSFVLAAMSYHFIEKRSYSGKSKYIVAGSLLIFVVGFGLSNINPSKYLGENGNLAFAVTRYKKENAILQYNLGTRHVTDKTDYNTFNKDFLYQFSKNGQKNVILLGDSHAGMFAKTFENISKECGFNLIQITADATYPMLNANTKFPNSRLYFNYIFEKYIPSVFNKIDLVIISSNYNVYHDDTLLKNISFTQNYFTKYKIPYFFLGQTDRYYLDFPTNYYLNKTYSINYYQTKRSLQRSSDCNTKLKGILQNTYFDLQNLPIEKVSKDEKPYIYDSDHLSYYGTEQYKAYIKKEIQNYLKAK